MTHYLHLPDPLYGSIQLDKQLEPVIQHPLFQRLQSVKQLGTLDFVYPYANHSRYEHSLGTAHLARIVGQSLNDRHPDITQDHILELQLAALLHDVGHGPFSHSFDHFMHTVMPDSPVAEHEARSIIFTQTILTDCKFNTEVIEAVCYLIDPDERNRPQHLLQGLEGIVNNNIHKLDIDKMDYLIRDAMYLRYDQILRKIDIPSLLKRTRIIDGKWLFHLNDRGIIYELICRRYTLYTDRYLETRVTSLGCMLTDILKTADPHLKLQETIAKLTDPEQRTQGIQEWLHLDDSILVTIRNEQNTKLSKCKQLIDDMWNGTYYKHIGDYSKAMLTDDSQYSFVNLNIFTDQSTPTNLLPKVLYYKGNEIVEGALNRDSVRVFKKS